MRNKKSFLSFGIIALVLFLGVGYAVVSSVYLNIGGTASVANADLNVEITNVVATTSVAGKNLDFTNVLSNKNLDSTFTLNGLELNEKVTITYTVTNNETDVDAEIKLASGVELTNSNSDFFDVNYSIPDSITDLASGDKTMEVVVTVELVQTPVTEEEGITTVGLKLAAIPKGGSENIDFDSEAKESGIYYNQPYNAVVFDDSAIAQQSSYVYRNSVIANNLSTSVKSSYVNLVDSNTFVAEKVDDVEKMHIKTIVVYDDHTVDIFFDGLLQNSYPAGSAIIDGSLLNINNELSAEISSDYKTIIIGDEIFELNADDASLKVGEEHIYGQAYVEDLPGQLMSMSVAFKNNKHVDCYFNGHLFGESSTIFYTVGNVIYLQDEGQEPTLYAYISIDGNQLIRKGTTIFTYQGKDKLFYGRAYSTYQQFDEDEDVDKVTLVPYRDGSFDLVIDLSYIQTFPEGSIEISGDNIVFNAGEDVYEFTIENDGYSLVSEIFSDNVYFKAGLIVTGNWYKSIVDNLKYNVIADGELLDTFNFYNGVFTDKNGNSGEYIICDKALILEGLPFVFYYDESTNEFFTVVTLLDGSSKELRMVPVSE